MTVGFPEHLFVYPGIAVAAFLSFSLKKLTLTGSICGFIIASIILIGVGYPGVIMLATFFVAGTVTTTYSAKTEKEKNKSKDDRGRTAEQVLANAGVASVLSLLAYCYPGHVTLFRLILAGSIAAAIADTLSSELGIVYGTRFYDIITFKRSVAGPDGVASLEGTLIGIIGAALIALIYMVNAGFDRTFFIIIVAGAVGNVTDSVLGATLERNGIIGNNLVNFLNTLAGALVCLIYSLV